MTRELSNNYIVNGFPWFGTKLGDDSMQTAIEASTNHPVLFVKMEFDSGDVNFHSGVGEITWGGDTYSGTGKLGSVSGIEENSDLTRTPITLGLSGLPTDLLAGLLSENYQGRQATVYIGYLSMTTYTLVSDPIILYRGIIDTPIVEEGETFSISLTVESKFAQWDRPKVRRYTHQDQRSRHAADTFFQYMEQGVEKQIIWGAKTP